MRREVTNFYRAVNPLLSVLTRVERNVDEAELQPYLRDVHDHLHLISEEVAAQKDLLATVLQANMAVISVEQTQVSVRQNSTMEQLTILATVFLPLTFITGFFGQNFAWLTDNITGFPDSPCSESAGCSFRWPCSGCGCVATNGRPPQPKPTQWSNGQRPISSRSGPSTATPTLRSGVRMLGWPRWRPVSAHSAESSA